MAKKNKDFSPRLLKAMQDAGVTREDLIAAGISRSATYNYFPAKEDTPSGRVAEWDQLVILSRVLGRSINWLLTGEDATPTINDVQLKDCVDALSIKEAEIADLKQSIADLRDARDIRQELIDNLKEKVALLSTQPARKNGEL